MDVTKQRTSNSCSSPEIHHWCHDSSNWSFCFAVYLPGCGHSSTNGSNFITTSLGWVTWKIWACAICHSVSLSFMYFLHNVCQIKNHKKLEAKKLVRTWHAEKSEKIGYVQGIRVSDVDGMQGWWQELPSWERRVGGLRETGETGVSARWMCWGILS